MVFALNLLALLLGFGLLVYFGDKLVDNAVAIAQKWSIPSSVIAATLLAAGTSAPELVTSFLAALQKSSDISIGNVVGSNIFNLMAVGGAVILLKPNGSARGAFFSWPFLLVSSLVFAGALSDLVISSWEGLGLTAMAIFFVLFSLKFASKDQKSDDDPPEEDPHNVWYLGFWTLISFVGLIGGAQLALYGGIGLGQLAGLSERVIGITIISIGTGLPELATSIAAVLKGRNDMALGNILGSNVYNTLGIPGLTASVFPLVARKELFLPDTAVMLTATVLIGLVFAFKSGVFNRLLGAFFVLGYVAYCVHMLIAI